MKDEAPERRDLDSRAQLAETAAGADAEMRRFDRSLLASLYARAAGLLTPDPGSVTEAVSWAAAALGVSDRTLWRWLGGDVLDRPTREQLVRLRTAAEVDRRARRFRDRRSRPEALRTAREQLERLEAGAVEAAGAEIDQERARALADPFRWRSWGAWARARKKAGLPPPRPPRFGGWATRVRGFLGDL